MRVCGKGWNGAGMKARKRHEKRMRRELESWPRGGAGGFEPVGDVIKRVVDKINQRKGQADVEP